MAKKKIYGLASVLMGAVGSDGGMGATLVEVLGATVKGTASLIYTPPTIADVEIEEEDTPYDQLITAGGKWELKMDSHNVSAKTLGDTFGGDYVPGTGATPDSWSGDDMVLKEGSFRVTTRNGVVLDLPRVKYMAIPTFNFDKTQLGRIALTGTPLKPTKAGTRTIKYTDAPTV